MTLTGCQKEHFVKQTYHHVQACQLMFPVCFFYLLCRMLKSPFVRIKVHKAAEDLLSYVVVFSVLTLQLLSRHRISSGSKCTLVL